MPGDTPEIAPSLPVNSAPPSAGSQQTAPPDVLDRPPIPAPPAVTLIDPLNGGQAKPPLAWRSKAFKMQTTQATGVRTMKSVTAGQNDTLAALISAIQKAGLTVDSVFDPAGQVLAHSADPALKNINLIFALVPIDSGHVIVKAAVDPDSRAIKTNSLDDILTQMAQLVQNNRGML
jgi:hypothetical protein